MSILSPFQPRYGSKQSVAPAAASASITIGVGSKTLRVRNTGATNVMHFRVGRASDGTVTASAADLPLYPGEVVYIEKSQDFDTMAFISAAGTTADVIPGEGGIGSAG